MQERVQSKEHSMTPRQEDVIIETAAVLRTMVFPPIRYVVPGYIAEGCTILAGRPKIGKSWLMLEAALAVSTGGECLGGIKCEPGSVLYLALEDNRRRLQSRITKLQGAQTREWPDAFCYATEWPRADGGGLNKIRDWIASAKNPRLVVVDVLAAFRTSRGDRQTQYDADYEAVQPLQRIAGETGVAIVIVHHLRKSGAEVDPFEKVSGTLGLSGGADTVLILDRDGNGATLYARGRDIEEIESAVEFDRTVCRWRVLGTASNVRRTDERSMIFTALREANEAMTPTDIAAATGMPNANVRQLLLKMTTSGEITKTARGRYTHPDNNPPITTITRSQPLWGPEQ